MKYKEFMIELQQYYGIYENNIVKHDVYEYVKKKYYQSELEQLLKNIKESYSRKWKVIPDIAIINETEKKYPIIQYIQGYRQIPKCEKKKQIEQKDNEEKDYSEEVHKLWIETKKRMKEKMKHIRQEKE